MKLYSEKQLKLFNKGTKIKFNLIDGEIDENVDGIISYNSPENEQIFVECKYGEYQFEYKELKEVLR